MSVALHGNLRDFGIGEVFQLIGQQRKTGVLQIEGSGQRLLVSFENGKVVRASPAAAHGGSALGEAMVRAGMLAPESLAEIERTLPSEDEGEFEGLLLDSAAVAASELEDFIDLLTRDTIFALLRWTKGSFHFTPQAAVRSRDPGRLLPAEQILMDGLRMVDEWRTLPESVRRDETVLQRASRFDAFRTAQPQASPERLAIAERVFLLVDGRLSVRRVIELSRLGTFECTRVLGRLVTAGVLEPVDEEVLARRLWRAGAASPARPVPSVPAAVLPFVFLGAMALWASLASPPGPGPAVGLRDVPREARLAFESRGLRNWIEAYRFARGRWPSDLAALDEFSSEETLSSAPLAASREHPYYYRPRGDTFLLLAPEH